jgi:hypothetical protein
MIRDPSMNYQGSCHCGAVAFEVDAPSPLAVLDCNCSICTKSGFLHLIVPKSRFRLVRGDEALSTYTFNTGVAKHFFCKTCGMKPFYIPRSNPDGIDVNVRCLDPVPGAMTIEPFDGRNWEANGASLASLSNENSRRQP